MASLFKRSVVLTTARLLALAVQFLTPVFLVRLLTPSDYGRYQEFIVYSMLAVSFVEFSINSNLPYFISRDPDRERQFVTNTLILNLVYCVVGITVIQLARGQLLELTTFDFVSLMIVYLIVYVNFDFLEFYWIAKGQTSNVLYYSFALAMGRGLFVVITAWLTKSVLHVMYAVIALYALKSLGVALYSLWKRLLVYRIDTAAMKAQLGFIVPLGSAAVILYFNNEISKVIVSSQLGAVALAMYAIGSKQVPFTSVIRASVSDVIFPEFVRFNVEDPKRGLDLWKRANVVYTFLSMPVFVTFFFYADVIITTLFTQEYARAVPIFRIYLLLMVLRDMVEMGSPLRALNQNKFFIYGNVLSLAVNIVFLYLLFTLYGFYGPAMAIVVTTLALQVFLGTRIVRAYRIRIGELFMWRKHALVFVVGAACVPILLGPRLIPLPALVGVVVFSAAYVLAYTFAFRRLHVEEVDTIMSRILGRVGLKW